MPQTIATNILSAVILALQDIDYRTVMDFTSGAQEY